MKGFSCGSSREWRGDRGVAMEEWLISGERLGKHCKIQNYSCLSRTKRFSLMKDF